MSGSPTHPRPNGTWWNAGGSTARRATPARAWSALGADVVIDMICFDGESARRMVEALRPTQPLLLHCGTIWVHGPAARVPITEDEPRTAYGEYGTGKLQAETYLLRQREVPTVILHPGHISGPGWPVITPAGNLDARVWKTLADGDPLPLPDMGLGVLHHVHADDVAQAFEKAITRPAAIGSSFHVVAAQAMTTRGLADGVAAWWGRRAKIEHVGWDEYERRVGAEHAQATREHVGRSHRRRASIGPGACSTTRRATRRCRRSRRRCSGWRRRARST